MEKTEHHSYQEQERQKQGGSHETYGNIQELQEYLTSTANDWAMS